MDLGYRNDIQYMKTEEWVNFFCTFLSYGLGWKRVRDLKSGHGRWRAFSMGYYFPHDIIIFLIVGTFTFCCIKFTCNRCVCSIVIIFT